MLYFYSFFYGQNYFNAKMIQRIRKWSSLPMMNNMWLILRYIWRITMYGNNSSICNIKDLIQMSDSQIINRKFLGKYANSFKMMIGKKPNTFFSFKLSMHNKFICGWFFIKFKCNYQCLGRWTTVYRCNIKLTRLPRHDGNCQAQTLKCARTRLCSAD